MEIEKDEYLCSLSFSMVYDPVKIAPTDFLYDRDSVETWVEKNPLNATIPQTRDSFVATDITPAAALRAEMRQYFQRVKGNEYTGWEVIPDYPEQLSLNEIRNLVGDILQLFPTTDAEENLRRMGVESWSNAWKRLTFLRLNLQMNAINLQSFLSNEQWIKSLEKFIVYSYTRGRITEESEHFHREILRTILGLDLTTHHPLVLGLLSPIAEILEPKQLLRILSYFKDAEPVAVSSTDLKNFALILDGFLRSNFRNFREDDSQLILTMQKHLLAGFVQIVIYAVGIFKSEDCIGVVADACQALRVALFRLIQLLDDSQQFVEMQLAFSVHIDLLTYINEMIKEAVTQESPHWLHLSVDHWYLALNIANILYQNVGNADIMRNTEIELYRSFLNSPIARDSELLTESLNIILDMFSRFVGPP